MTAAPRSAVPARTATQRQEALDKALATRQERARLRGALKGGDIHPADVISGSASNQVWAGVKVLWLLESVPGMGPVRAERLMASLAIAPSRRVQGLGERQRASLVRELRGER